MKFSGFADAFAKPVIGKVEVFEPNTPPDANNGSESLVTVAYSLCSYRKFPLSI